MFHYVPWYIPSWFACDLMSTLVCFLVVRSRLGHLFCLLLNIRVFDTVGGRQRMIAGAMIAMKVVPKLQRWWVVVIRVMMKMKMKTEDENKDAHEHENNDDDENGDEDDDGNEHVDEYEDWGGRWRWGPGWRWRMGTKLGWGIMMIMWG